MVGVLDWVLAELIRLHHNVPADEAQKIVEQLVERRAPVVEDFDGFLKVLKPDLARGDHCLVLLYQSGRTGARLFPTNSRLGRDPRHASETSDEP